jgi:phosphohistidine phosphatase
MMNLYLLRHSNAEERPPRGETGDRARQLTPEGREKARMIGRAIRRLELPFDLILTSPAARARQTAELVVAELKPRPPLELCDALWIGGNLREIGARVLKGPKPPQNVLLVGHEPDLGRIASLLLTGDRHLDVVFKKGGLSFLSIGRLKYGRCAALEWHLTPRQLRLIAGRL